MTQSGRIVFDGVSRTSSNGYSHSEHGTVTPVNPHTFHGGVDEPDDAEKKAPDWWNEGPAINRHKKAMSESFPQFVFYSADNGRGPFWVGDIDTGRGRFTIGVILRREGGLPSVLVLKGGQLGARAGRRWIKSPHLYTSGNICVADQSDWDPERDTVATVTAWAAHWLAAYTEWRFARNWPVEGFAMPA
ncbi:hypothetical protein GOEFS_017_00380 [Gordonia effusa NBRC 100432]|uniref:Type II CBASS E2 protein domain-containing protein n=1 Tax=Gordonia effusa NBRC 100432 TaxID=1077974 RepID=H0QVS1_9ACTN|nr:hypothetical protein [Gordonia effusa]GAB16922.1 hypothetical protein GOEFS_017_00380 [Gordonia effusa NBRC 100432]